LRVTGELLPRKRFAFALLFGRFARLPTLFVLERLPLHGASNTLWAMVETVADLVTREDPFATHAREAGRDEPLDEQLVGVG
jgi:hypothetical protein